MLKALLLYVFFTFSTFIVAHALWSVFMNFGIADYNAAKPIRANGWSQTSEVPGNTALSRNWPGRRRSIGAGVARQYGRYISLLASFEYWQWTHSFDAFGEFIPAPPSFANDSITVNLNPRYAVELHDILLNLYADLLQFSKNRFKCGLTGSSLWGLPLKHQWQMSNAASQNEIITQNYPTETKLEPTGWRSVLTRGSFSIGMGVGAFIATRLTDQLQIRVDAGWQFIGYATDNSSLVASVGQLWHLGVGFELGLKKSR